MGVRRLPNAPGIPVAQPVAQTGVAVSNIYTVSGLKAGSTAILYDNGVQTSTTTVSTAGKATWTLASAPTPGHIMTYDGVVTGSAGVVPVATPVVTNPSTGGGASTGSGSTGGSTGSTGGSTGSTGSTGGSTSTPAPTSTSIAAAQASSRASEVSAAGKDTGRGSTGSGTFANLARPTISGKAKVGENLIGYPGLWPAAAGLSYAWLVGGATVPGANTRLYTVASADSGKTVEFQVKASDGTVVKSVALTAFASMPTLDDDQGVPLTTDTGAVLELSDRALQILAPYSPDVNRTNKFANPSATGITVTVSDADIYVGPNSLPVSIYAPGTKALNVYHSGKVQLALIPDADGYAQGILPLTGIKNGALWVEVHALVDNTDENITTYAIVSGFDVVVRGGDKAALNAVPPAAAALGLTAVGFSEDFSQALNVSNDNTLPSGGKWFGNQAFDPRGYGDSTFAPPNGPYGTMTVMDGMLRVRAKYDPAAQAALKDGFGRQSGWVSGTICTSFPDATTTVPKMGVGYYECEIRAPKGIGTWPAFWLNDQGGLMLAAKGTPSAYGRETDGYEQYNETPGHVSTQHRYQPNPNFDSSKPESDSNKKTIDKSTEFHVANDLGQECWAWVRVGILTLPDRIEYYVNDKLVGTDTKFNPPDRGSIDPGLEHIILGLAMGGGWPLGVPPSKYYDCYFRNVRQFQKAA